MQMLHRSFTRPAFCSSFGTLKTNCDIADEAAARDGPANDCFQQRDESCQFGNTFRLELRPDNDVETV